MSLRRSVVPTATCLALVAGAVAVTTPATASAPGAEAAGAGRVETRLPTPPGPFPDVVKSVVTIDAPLPAGVRGAPAACQKLRYYRYRHAAGPANASAADAVFVVQPGGNAGASSLEMNALAVVQNAAKQGRRVEQWALDRRSGCVDDRTGLDAALKARNAAVAADYYLRGKPVNGRTFAGFPKSADVPYLAAFDLKQTLEDYRTVIVQGIPDPKVRQSKVFCGGHSTGGVLTGALMAWDFDGDAATREDAGYKLCAGTIALDSTVSVSRNPFGPGGDEDAAAATGTEALEAAAAATDSLEYTLVTNWINDNFRILDTGFYGPETMTMLMTIGLNAQFAPDADSSALIDAVPAGGNGDLAQRLMHSQNLWDVLGTTSRLNRQRLTGEALLGAFMDDNSQLLFPLQVSVGSFDRGPVEAKEFPWLDPKMMFPTDDGQLYGWANYNEKLPDLRRADGTPFTTAASEITDIRDLARVLPIGPLDFIESYFPTRLIVDVLYASSGSRAGDLAHLLYVDAPRTRPRLTLVSGDRTPDSGGSASRPLEPPIGDVANQLVTLPGYNHLDVITASPAQNDGRPEQAALLVARFLLTQVGKAPTTEVPVGTGAAAPTTVTQRLESTLD